jgi:oleandomycin transport system ATP-binding protein
VVFLDEPSVGLDPGKRDELWQMIRGLSADGVTVLLTTQYLEEADALADAIAVIDHGRVIASGTPAVLKSQVGGHAITVRPNDSTDTDAVATILADVAGRAPERSTRHELVVPVTGDEAFFEIAARLREQRIGVSELSLRLPSLDEVFLALTGAPTTATEHATEPTKAA